jgi:hypothetical protein
VREVLDEESAYFTTLPVVKPIHTFVSGVIKDKNHESLCFFYKILSYQVLKWWEEIGKNLEKIKKYSKKIFILI